MEAFAQIGDAAYTGVGNYERGTSAQGAFRLQDHITRREPLSGLTPGTEGEGDPAEKYTEGLRASRLRGGAPHHAPAARRTVLVGLHAQFLGADNASYLARRLVDESRRQGLPLAEEQVYKFMPAWQQAFARRLADHAFVRTQEATVAAQLAEVNAAFVRDRLSLAASHGYLVREHAAGDAREDHPGRYDPGEFSSVYWDMNRELSTPAHLSARREGEGATRTLEGAGEPPLVVSKTPAFLNPSRFGKPQTPAAAASYAAAAHHDRDRTVAIINNFRARTDRKPLVVRGRTQRASVRDDYGESAGSLNLDGDPRIGCVYGSALRAREGLAAAATKKANATRREYFATSSYR